VWQGRFFSCPLDETHVGAAVRYVERTEQYAWSRKSIPAGITAAASKPPYGAAL